MIAPAPQFAPYTNPASGAVARTIRARLADFLTADDFVTGGSGTDGSPYTGWQAAAEALAAGQTMIFRGGKVYGYTGTLKLPQDGGKWYGNGATLKCTSATGMATLTCQLTGQTHTIGVRLADPIPGSEQFGFNEKVGVEFVGFTLDGNNLADRGLFLANHLHSLLADLTFKNNKVWAAVTRRAIGCTFARLRSQPWGAVGGQSAQAVNGFWFGEDHPSQADDAVTVCHMDRIAAWDHRGIGIKVGNSLSFSNVFTGGFSETNNRNLDVGGIMNHFNGFDFELSGAPGGATPPANTTDPDVTGEVASVVRSNSNTFTNCNAIGTDLTFLAGTEGNALRRCWVQVVTNNGTNLRIEDCKLWDTMVNNGAKTYRSDPALTYDRFPQLWLNGNVEKVLRLTSSLPGIELASADAVTGGDFWNANTSVDDDLAAFISLDIAAFNRVFGSGASNYMLGIAAGEGKEVQIGSRNAVPITRMVGGRMYHKVPTSAPADGDLKNGEISFWFDESANTLKAKIKRSDGTVRNLTGLATS